MSSKPAAKDMGPSNLVMSHFTLERTHPIADRIASAAGAGFDGIGLYIGEYARLKSEGFAPHGLRDLLAEHDIVLAEIEVVRGWAGTAEAKTTNERSEAIAWEMADEFDCRYLQAIGPSEGSISDAGREFGALCDRAGEHGLVVGIEFLPFTNIVTAADALAIVEEADRVNGGICVDIWHHTRGANDLSLIEAIPSDKVLGIQMNDGPIVPDDPDYYTDCLHNRVPPGDGEFDVDGFVGLLLAKGVTVPWSLEVCQDSAWGRPGLEHATRCAAGMRAALARCK
jgi:sugar phosphate isomerase/epimerase